MKADSREYPARPICGVGVVVRRGGDVLLVRRGNPPRRGEWSLPGGAVELGETLRQAAQREIREECGIEIELGPVLDVFEIMQRDEHDRLQYHYVVVDFAGDQAGGSLRAGSDALEVRWVDPREIESYGLPESTRQVIDKATALADRPHS